jgi:hypothetical protein
VGVFCACASENADCQAPVWFEVGGDNFGQIGISMSNESDGERFSTDTRQNDAAIR